MIKITFPDGSVREYNEGVTGLQIAESISSRLAQDVLACGVNGETIDLSRPINEDANFVLYKWEDEQGKHAFWHTSAHLLAEAEGFEAMVKAAERNPEIAIQYKMVDQWKEIASEQVKAFEHIQLGNVTVFDGGNGTTSNFLQNVVSKVAPALGILDKLPIHDTYQNIVNPSSKGNAQNKPEKEDFEPVDKDGKKRPTDTPPAPDKK